MTFEEVYRKYEHLTVEIVDELDNPLECAGAMMGQAMKLYKVVLSSEDFDALMQIISQASGLEGSGFDDDYPSGTLH
jgi:hypothetical protein